MDSTVTQIRRWAARAIALAAVAMVPWGVASDAAATTLVAMSTKDLTLQSTGIVVGTVVSSVSKRDETHNIIVTESTVAISQSVKGTWGRTMTVQTPGGVVGNIGMQVPGAPQLTVGDEVLLFLYRGPDKTDRILGLSQGAYKVRTDPVTGEKSVRRNMSDVKLADTHTQTLVDGNTRERTRSLEALLSEVRSYLAAAE